MSAAAPPPATPLPTWREWVSTTLSSKIPGGVWPLIIFMGLRHVLKFALFVPHITADPRVQPLVRVVEPPPFGSGEPLLAPNAFEALRARLVGNRTAANEPRDDSGLIYAAAAQSNALSAHTFGGSRGFVLRFNNDGADTAFADERAVLRPFFDAAKDPEADAFVLNVLVIDPAEDDEAGFNEFARAADGSDPGLADSEPSSMAPATADYSIGLHVDNTVGIRSVRKFFAHEVGVLYVQVPSTARGGELEVHASVPEDPAAAVTSAATPVPEDGILANVSVAVVAPKEGRFIAFRGDAHHRVRTYFDDALRAVDGIGRTRTRPRVSLVLESYRVGSTYYGQTTVFELLDGDHRKYDLTGTITLGLALGFHTVSTWALVLAALGLVGVLCASQSAEVRGKMLGILRHQQEEQGQGRGGESNAGVGEGNVSKKKKN